jgi:hypothetical protein
MADLIVKAAVKEHLDQMNVSADFVRGSGDSLDRPVGLKSVYGGG